MEISDTVDTKLSIGTKSIDDVERFLREHDHIVDVFKALCLVQIVIVMEILIQILRYS